MKEINRVPDLLGIIEGHHLYTSSSREVVAEREKK